MLFLSRIIRDISSTSPSPSRSTEAHQGSLKPAMRGGFFSSQSAVVLLELSVLAGKEPLSVERKASSL